MRILIIDTYYQEALERIYSSHPGLEGCSYAEQISTVYNFGFARANFLPLNLRKLGHEVEQFVVSARPLQLQWALEHGLEPSIAQNGLYSLGRYWKRGQLSLKSRLGFQSGRPVDKWEARIVEAQVESFRPDVVLVCDVLYLPTEVLKRLKSSTRLLVGEMAYPIPAGLDLSPFDLILSAAPHFVDRLRQAGVESELLRLGFEPSVLDRLGPLEKTEGLVFIGSIGSHHQERIALLEALHQKVQLSCWGSGAHKLPVDSPLRARVKPPLWGYEMYRQLRQAKIALNIHIDMAERFAANMRLYEATGVGTMLLTDWKENLPEMFTPGVEVVAYRTPEECVDLARYYLSHDSEREEIARGGQERTLREHTYYHRMQQMTEMFEARL
jgi:hypothetical protein